MSRMSDVYIDIITAFAQGESIAAAAIRLGLPAHWLREARDGLDPAALHDDADSYPVGHPMRAGLHRLADDIEQERANAREAKWIPDVGESPIAVGMRVRIVNGHGEPLPAGIRLGMGWVRSLYADCGEQRAEVYFPKAGKRGGWPVALLREV